LLACKAFFNLYGPRFNAVGSDVGFSRAFVGKQFVTFNRQAEIN